MPKTIDEWKETITSYVAKMNSEDNSKNYITWDLRDIPEQDIGYTCYSKNEYCGYRGETNEIGMLKMFEANNRKDWLMISQLDVEDFLWGYIKERAEEGKELIQQLWDKQDEWGFVLCIKYIQDNWRENTMASYIYNVERLDDPREYYGKYFNHNHTWYLFAIPKC